MTDNPANAAAPDLGVYPDKPFSPTPADTTPAMSFDAAMSRKNEMFADAAWRDRYMAGDLEARAEYDRVVRSLAFGQPPPPTDPASVDQLEEWVRQQADVSEAVIEEIRTSRPVSPLERRLALQRKESRFRDASFVQRYFDNDSDARREVLLLNVILSSPMRDQP